MRTVILNTLGSELRQTSLFYLPFREDQFLWVERDLANIASAAEDICTHSYNQGKVQDYHLVVLVSLARYSSARFQQLRKVYEDMFFMHVRTELLLPLAQEYSMPPKATSIVFMVPKRVNGTGDVPVEEQLDELLGFRGRSGAVERLQLTDDNGATLDMSSHFVECLNDYKLSCENEVAYKGNANTQYALKNFRSSLERKIDAAQSCRYIPIGEDTPRDLQVEKLEFFPKTTDWELFCIDLQINLCDHLTKSITDRDWHLQLQARDDETIREVIYTALRRVRYLRNAAPKESYYALTPPEEDIQTKALTSTIWAALMKNTELPGVADLKAVMGETIDFEKDVSADDIPIPGVKMRHSWLMVGREKKRFTELCDILEKQFAEGTAEAQQKEVLDTCSEQFAQWRSAKITEAKKSVPKPTEYKMPEFDTRKAEEELHASQQTYSQVKLDALEDYDDLRQEAEQIKADFRKTWRLWPDDPPAASWFFWRYSLILGVSFLLLVLLPFVVITWGQIKGDVGRVTYFGFGTAVFVAMYLTGVLIWLRMLCKQLAEYNLNLYQLLQKSHARRRESIRRIVQAFGQELPQCTIQYEKVQYMRFIHEKNLRRKHNFNAHMRILDEAEDLLVEMQTMLRLPPDQETIAIHTKRQVNYQCEPSDPINVPCYIILSEKWGC